MLMQTVDSAFSLDSSTLVVVATCIAVLLGLFLLFAWTQDRTQALAWWGLAYLMGGIASALWALNGALADRLPPALPNALLLIACGMMWSGARAFYGRAVIWPGLFAGAALWLAASGSEWISASPAYRIALTAVIVAVYTVLTSHELWSERRRALIRRWPAMLVPLLHGAVFLVPIPMVTLMPSERGFAVAGGWTALFAIEALLYAVGTAFLLLILAQQRAVHIHKAAASTDALTGVFNRRAFLAGAETMVEAQAAKGEPISLLVFDLDRFKSINDRFGHAVGDEVLRLFAQTASETTRTTDIFARLGGEEFVMILAGDANVAATVGERVRFAFELQASAIGEYPIGATVSIGAAGSYAATTVKSLLTRADAALYRAKANGRNRIEVADREPEFGVSKDIAALPKTVLASSVPALPAPMSSPQPSTPSLVSPHSSRQPAYGPALAKAA
jgi:diguanylate cyclase (GGDEF)-like protein